MFPKILEGMASMSSALDRHKKAQRVSCKTQVLVHLSEAAAPALALYHLHAVAFLKISGTKL